MSPVAILGGLLASVCGLYLAFIWILKRAEAPPTKPFVWDVNRWPID